MARELHILIEHTQRKVVNMKRKPTSKIYHTALYLHRVRGQHTFTGRDIHNTMPAARTYYRSLIPDSVFAERDRLIAEHRPDVDWDTTHMYTDWDMRECDRPLRDLFRPYVTFDYPYYNDNLTFAEISNAYKHGYLLRDDSSPFVYHINPVYLED